MPGWRGFGAVVWHVERIQSGDSEAGQPVIPGMPLSVLYISDLKD